MSDREKAEKLSAALVRCCNNRNVIDKLSLEAVLKAFDSDELDLYYRTICKGEN